MAESYTGYRGTTREKVSRHNSSVRRRVLSVPDRQKNLRIRKNGTPHWGTSVKTGLLLFQNRNGRGLNIALSWIRLRQLGWRPYISMLWRYLIAIPWITFVAYWLVGTLKTRRTIRRESFASRYGVLLLEILGFAMLFSRVAEVGVLGQHVVPQTYTSAVTGVVLTWIGIAIALWARWRLGQYWSARVTLKEGHKLIRTGPYAYFRHPIYSGLDLAALGAALAIGEWRCVVAVGFIVVGYWIKAKKEESMLASQFGEAFEEHRRHTGFLIPKF